MTDESIDDGYDDGLDDGLDGELPYQDLRRHDFNGGCNDAGTVVGLVDVVNVVDVVDGMSDAIGDGGQRGFVFN